MYSSNVKYLYNWNSLKIIFTREVRISLQFTNVKLRCDTQRKLVTDLVYFHPHAAFLIKNKALTYCCQDCLNWTNFTADKKLMATYPRSKTLIYKITAQGMPVPSAFTRWRTGSSFTKIKSITLDLQSWWSHQKSHVSTNWL